MDREHIDSEAGFGFLFGVGAVPSPKTAEGSEPATFHHQQNDLFAFAQTPLYLSMPRILQLQIQGLTRHSKKRVED